MAVLSTEAIRDLGWGDATFHGLIWENDGKDLKLHIDHATMPVFGLVCHWASDLKIDLNWGRPQSSTDDNPLRRGGALLTWECKMDTSKDGRWTVTLDFAGDGHVTFECEKITAVTGGPPNKPLQPSGSAGG